MWWASFPALVVASALEAAALVPFRYLATEDGPSNIASAHIIASYPGPYRPYFHLDFFPKFDMLWQLALSIAVRVIPALVAERLLLVLLVIGLPLAGWYAARGVRDDAGPVAFLLLPLSIGWFQHAGYHSFCLGLVLFLVTIGWWLRHRDGGLGSGVVLAAILIITYLAHITAVAMAMAMMAVLVIWEAATGDRRGWARRSASLGAAVPVAVLIGLYIVRQPTETGTDRLAFTTLAKSLVTLRPALASMDRREAALSLLVGLTLIGLALTTLWRLAPRRLRDPSHGWLVATIAVVAVYFVVPDRIGTGTQINARVSLFVVMAAVLWLAGFKHSKRVTAIFVGLSLVAAAGLTVLHVPKYVAFDRDLREFASVGGQIPRGATVVPVYLVPPGETHPGLAASRWTRPVIQASGYLVAEHDIVDLSQFNGAFSYFITQFRPEVDPFRFIGRGRNWLGDSPPEVDLLGYETATGGRGRIDYVIVWGDAQASVAVTSSAAYRSLHDQLARGFELVYTSARGHLQLYRHR